MDQKSLSSPLLIKTREATCKELDYKKNQTPQQQL